MPGPDDLAIRLVAAGEAASLIALMRRGYRNSYIDPDFYDEVVVSERLASGRLYSIGAFSTAGAWCGRWASACARTVASPRMRE